MKRSLLICSAALMTLLSVPQVQADSVILTLDLQNTNRTQPLNGGTWRLFARKVETGSAPEGNHGISGIRALISNITPASVTFAAGNGHMTTGGPYVQTLTNGTVEIVYGQDLNGTVVTAVGVNAVATQDDLIASGTWPAGPRPIFGNDGATPTPFTSEVNFLGAAAAPFPASVQATAVTTEIYTLGDLNGSNTITTLDINGFVSRLPGATVPLPYHPAADINQSGTVTTLDINGFVTILGGPAAAPAIGAVPEPSTMGLAILASMGLIARRRRV